MFGKFFDFFMASLGGAFTLLGIITLWIPRAEDPARGVFFMDVFGYLIAFTTIFLFFLLWSIDDIVNGR